jgi:transposase-like protein
MTLEQIGNAEHISRERVRQICKRFDIDTGPSEELTPRQLEAVQGYLAGDSLVYVAAAYAVAPSALRAWIIRAGYQMRGRGAYHSPAIRLKAASAARLYQSGEPIGNIARDLGLKNPEAVYRLLAINGIRPDRSAGPRVTQ